ncbi:MAG: glycyl-radical enzyme activating protein [Tepidanaerobacteraceae bacterium]|jgi:pyruvate formate lyase activating enzyme
MEKGIVFNIQKLSIHDGPGIRTLVFLKGCPLRCLWCSNPESQKAKPQVASFHKRCIGCGVCEVVCPQKAIKEIDGLYIIDDELCDDCGICVKECYTNSKQFMGKEMTVEEVVEEVMKDNMFYKRSGGGVTFSGGEPLMQPAFLLALLKEFKKQNVNTAIETSGYCDTEVLKEIADYLDIIHYDIKHMDTDIHKKITGVSNELILKNLKALDSKRKKIIVRIPIIPTYNDSEEHIKSVVDFCSDLKSVEKIELLPYHNLGEYKYKSINREYELSELKTPDKEHMEKLLNIVQDAGIPCEIVEA